MNNEILVTLRDAFQRNCCVDVFYKQENLTLIPYELKRQDNKVVLYAKTEPDGELLQFLVDDIDGAKLDLLSQVPFDLPWDKKFVESRSFNIQQEKRETVNLVSIEEQEKKQQEIDALVKFETDQKRILAEQVAKHNKPTRASRKKHKKENVSTKNKPNRKVAIFGAIAIVAVAVPLALSNNDNSNFDEEEYKAWRETVDKQGLATEYKQDIPLDNSYEGIINDNVKIDFRFPYEEGPGSDQFSPAWDTILDDPEIDIIDYRLRSDAANPYGSMNRAYNSDLQCMVQENPANSVRSKTFIEENNVKNNDDAYTLLLVDEMLAEMGVEEPLAINPVSAYVYGERNVIEAYDVQVTDKLSFTMRGFSGNGTFIYQVNNCGLGLDELVDEQRFPIETYFYASQPSSEEGSNHVPQPK
jgi:actin-related protein